MRAISNPVSTGIKKSLLKGASVAALSSVLASTMMLSQNVNAEVATGSSGVPASVDLNFQIIIPTFLQFQVGSTGATVDNILFDMTGNEAAIGNSTAQAGTGGNLTGGSVDAVVRANGGLVTITEANDGAGFGLIDGSGNSISYSEIVTNLTSGALTAPTLSDAGTSSVVAPNTGGITDEAAVWTYEYANTTVPVAGTYDGTVTYTASLP